MRPRALEAIRPELEREAHVCIDPLVGRGPIEAMSTLASHLPTTIVSRMVGLPERARGKMLLWSKAIFNGIGPLNLRTLRSLPAVLGMMRTQKTLHPDEVRPGTWFDRLFALREAGELTDGEARGMFLDYVAPSLDTTIFATGHLLNRLARHPEAWEMLRADRSLVPSAVDESLRIDSVIRSFTRVAGRDAPLAGVSIPAGQRVVACYGGANRDPRRYADPDAFDITRDARDHLAFGHGPHACAGTRLARLEMETLLHALLDRVGRLEADAPTISMNNTLHGFSRLPLTLRA
jgi:cytochrome P450